MWEPVYDYELVLLNPDEIEGLPFPLEFWEESVRRHNNPPAPNMRFVQTSTCIEGSYAEIDELGRYVAYELFFVYQSDSLSICIWQQNDFKPLYVWED